MPKTTLYIAASINGYIADKDGGVDWLSIVEDGKEDYDFDEFYKSIDAVVMGKKTYDFCVNVSEWPYKGKQTYVFTHGHLSSERDDIKFLFGDAKKGFERIISDGHKKIWLVGGGLLNSQFLDNNLIDELILSIIPIVLGEGIELFPGSIQKTLTLNSSKQFPSGLVQLHYIINNSK